MWKNKGDHMAAAFGKNLVRIYEDRMEVTNVETGEKTIHKADKEESSSSGEGHPKDTELSDHE